MFEVAPNPRRPFIVTAGDKTVRAVGTSFIVRKAGDGVVVTLIQGKVAVSDVADGRPGPVAPPPTMLVPGERLTVTGDALSTIDRPSIDAVTAWRRGQAVFADTAAAGAPSPSSIATAARMSCSATRRSPRCASRACSRPTTRSSSPPRSPRSTGCASSSATARSASSAEHRLRFRDGDIFVSVRCRFCSAASSERLEGDVRGPARQGTTMASKILLTTAATICGPRPPPRRPMHKPVSPSTCPPSRSSGALRAIASQTGSNIVFSDAAVRGKTAPAVKGEFGTADAYRRALQGSGLPLTVTSGGSYVVGSPGNGPTPLRRTSGASGAIEGHVQQADGNRNIAGALVRIVETGAVAKADDLGNFRFLDLAPGMLHARDQLPRLRDRPPGARGRARRDGRARASPWPSRAAEFRRSSSTASRSARANALNLQRTAREQLRRGLGRRSRQLHRHHLLRSAAARCPASRSSATA